MTAITSPLGTLTGRVTSRIDRLSDRRFALLSFLPAGILIAVIVLPPILAIFGMSLFRINLLRDNNTPFVGLTNYLRIGDDANFLDSVPRTVIFAAGTTLLTVPLALGSAMVLNRRFRGAALLGVAILMPYAVAAVVTGLFWKFIFQSHFGIATGILTALGIVHGPVLWLADSNTAMFVAVMATAWKYTPLYALLILASLKAIPEALYRAAKMDGATAWQSFRYVTLAGIRNTMLVVTILTIILSLQVFDVLFTLTGGGPGQSTTVIYYYVFKNTVDLLNFGYSAALAVFLLVVIVLCSMALLVVRLRDKGPTVADDDLTATARPEYTRDAAKLASLHEGADDQAPRRRFVLPAWVGRWTFRIAVALLLFWLLAPIAWILIASQRARAGDEDPGDRRQQPEQRERGPRGGTSTGRPRRAGQIGGADPGRQPRRVGGCCAAASRGIAGAPCGQVVVRQGRALSRRRTTSRASCRGRSRRGGTPPARPNSRS